MSQPILLPCFDWDCHYASVPYESSQWASTDRGWVGLLNHPDMPDSDYHSPCVGNYLRYDRPNELGQHIHCCAYIFRRDAPLMPVGLVHLGSTWVDTLQDAKDWIESKVTAYLQKAS